jgi:hypothetical protein
MVAGYVRVYRPDSRKIEAGQYEFTVVNNTISNISVATETANSTSYKSLTPSNTTASFASSRYYGATGGVSVRVAGRSMAVVDGAGYEIYSLPDGTPGIRKL